MSVQTKILRKVADQTGPTVAILLKELIQESKVSNYIRSGDFLLFEINHEKMVKKMRQTTKNYWAMIGRLEDVGVVHRHFIQFTGEAFQKQYTEIDFKRLHELRLSGLHKWILNFFSFLNQGKS